jgi:hypothetical protein
MDDTTILSIIGIAVSLLSGLYVAFKHSACKSKCFGVENDFQIDLTPVSSDLFLEKIKVPIQNGGSNGSNESGTSKDKECCTKESPIAEAARGE